MSRRARTTVVLALAVAAGACGQAADDVAVPDDARTVDAPPDAWVPLVGPEVDGQLTINELMAANTLTLLDDGGAAGDWIELYNPTTAAIELRGYALTDDLALPKKSILPAGVVVPAGGRLLLWADAQPGRGPTHLGFGLGNAGGDLALTRPDGTFIDRLHYGAQQVDQSAAREPDGSDRWQIEWLASPGQANPTGSGAPMGLDDPSRPPEAVPAAGDLSEQILGYDVEPAFGFTVSAADALALEADPFTYVRATLTFRGRAYGPVGLRLKGANSFEPFSQKPSLKVSVDQYVAGARFFGLNHLTLDNMHSDTSMMHERLAYWMARKAGLPASRANHALVTVNEQFYGLYANVEAVKGRMLQRWFADASGPLFEATDVDFVAPYIPLFQLESGPDDRSLIIGLAAALTIPDADQAMSAAAAFVDVDQFQRYWALCSVIGQFDAFPYSFPGDDYHLYGDPVRKLTFIPWGMDETFFAADYDATATSSVLAARCKESPACFQAYVDRTWELVTLADTLGFEAERVRVAAQIAPLVDLDHRKSYDAAAVAIGQDAMHWFITERRLNLTAMLPPHTP